MPFPCGADAENVPFQLLQHRLAVATIAVALAATAGVFLFARPEYRPPHSAATAIPIPSYVTPAAHGWTWPHGLPGFRFGDDMRSTNIFGVNWATLSALRIASPAARVDPQSLRVLAAVRLRPHEPMYLLVGGRGALGRTCIGAQAGPAAPRFFCPEQLAGHVAIVNVAAAPSYSGRWPIYIGGVVSAAVTRITVWTAGMGYTDMRSGKPVFHLQGPQVVFQRRYKTWGTFESFDAQPVPWNARIDFYGAHGEKLASLPLRFTHPASSVYLR
jgi:hypothetical protein